MKKDEVSSFCLYYNYKNIELQEQNLFIFHVRCK